MTAVVSSEENTKLPDVSLQLPSSGVGLSQLGSLGHHQWNLLANTGIRASSRASLASREENCNLEGLEKECVSLVFFNYY